MMTMMMLMMTLMTMMAMTMTMTMNFLVNHSTQCAGEWEEEEVLGEDQVQGRL